MEYYALLTYAWQGIAENLNYSNDNVGRVKLLLAPSGNFFITSNLPRVNNWFIAATKLCTSVSRLSTRACKSFNNGFSLHLKEVYTRQRAKDEYMYFE